MMMSCVVERHGGLLITEHSSVTAAEPAKRNLPNFCSLPVQILRQGRVQRLEAAQTNLPRWQSVVSRYRSLVPSAEAFAALR